MNHKRIASNINLVFIYLKCELFKFYQISNSLKLITMMTGPRESSIKRTPKFGHVCPVFFFSPVPVTLTSVACFDRFPIGTFRKFFAFESVFFEVWMRDLIKEIRRPRHLALLLFFSFSSLFFFDFELLSICLVNLVMFIEHDVISHSRVSGRYCAYHFICALVNHHRYFTVKVHQMGIGYKWLFSPSYMHFVRSQIPYSQLLQPIAFSLYNASTLSIITFTCE